MATMADCARPARGLMFWTAGWIETIEEVSNRTKLIYVGQHMHTFDKTDTDRNGGLIHATAALGEIDVHNNGHGERSQVHE